MEIYRELFLDPKMWEQEMKLKEKLRDAIQALSPYFQYNPKALPTAIVENNRYNLSCNPKLNEVYAGPTCFPLLDVEVGEEAGHYLHFKSNPLFGKYSKKEGLLVRQLIEFVGRYSGIVYANKKGTLSQLDNINFKNLNEIHGPAYKLAYDIYKRNGPNFLKIISKWDLEDFKKLRRLQLKWKIKTNLIDI